MPSKLGSVRSTIVAFSARQTRHSTAAHCCLIETTSFIRGWFVKPYNNLDLSKAPLRALVLVSLRAQDHSNTHPPSSRCLWFQALAAFVCLSFPALLNLLLDPLFILSAGPGNLLAIGKCYFVSPSGSDALEHEFCHNVISPSY